LRCPFCKYPESRVIESRPAQDGNVIRRRRECIKCGRRFTTYERLEEIPLVVIKKDGRREFFEPQKVRTGILKACEKRPVSLEVINNLVGEIEAELRSRMDKEISSREIGEMIVERLRELDEVAYVRFASVYRQFKDVESFGEEIKRLKEKRYRKKDSA